MDPTVAPVLSFAVSGTNLFTGTYGGVFLSTNNGTSWNAVNLGLTNSVIKDFAVSGMNLFAGTESSGVFLPTNNGTSWTSTGLKTTQILALTFSGTNLFAGTYYSGVWRPPLSEMITSVQHSPGELPVTFRLEQNYPNPFNPSTTITFQIPSANFVTLKVLDLVGREVEMLLSEALPAGMYSRQWNAAGSPSGVYFSFASRCIYRNEKTFSTEVTRNCN